MREGCCCIRLRPQGLIIGLGHLSCLDMLGGWVFLRLWIGKRWKLCEEHLEVTFNLYN